MEHIETKNSLVSELKINFICFIRILSIQKVIAKNKVFEKSLNTQSWLKGKVKPGSTCHLSCASGLELARDQRALDGITVSLALFLLQSNLKLADFFGKNRQKFV